MPARNLTNTHITSNGRSITNTTNTNELIKEIANLKLLISALTARITALESG